MSYRELDRAEALALAASNPKWVRTYNTICDPPVTLWCEGDKPRMRATHYDERFGHHNETVYEVIE